MTEGELRDIDFWIAGVFLNLEVERTEEEHGGIFSGDSQPDIPHYSSHPGDFATIKREIERRNCAWECQEYLDYDNHPVFSFKIKDIYEAYRLISYAKAKSEELAGCLAVQMAVEDKSM